MSKGWYPKINTELAFIPIITAKTSRASHCEERSDAAI